MSASSTFDFEKVEERQDVQLPGSAITMRTVKSGNAVALLQFHDGEGVQIAVPSDVEVFDISDSNYTDKLAPVGMIFALGWTNDYCIKYRGKTVVKYVCLRQWACFEPRDA